MVLDGVSVRLEPLSMDHRSRLTAVGLDPELWRWTVSLVRTPAGMEEYMSRQALLRVGAKEEI